METPTPDERLLDDLETLLIALGMHPMFYRQPFKILRLNLVEMKTDGLPPDIIALKGRFAQSFPSSRPGAELRGERGGPINVIGIRNSEITQVRTAQALPSKSSA